MSHVTNWDDEDGEDDNYLFTRKTHSVPYQNIMEKEWEEALSKLNKSRLQLSNTDIETIKNIANKI